MLQLTSLDDHVHNCESATTKIICFPKAKMCVQGDSNPYCCASAGSVSTVIDGKNSPGGKRLPLLPATTTVVVTLKVGFYTALGLVVMNPNRRSAKYLNDFNEGRACWQFTYQL